MADEFDGDLPVESGAGEGVPALFDRSCFPELLALGNESVAVAVAGGNRRRLPLRTAASTTQSGAKSIILRDRERVAEFPFPEGKIDIDTAADYEKLNAKTELAQRTQRDL
jgi:CTP:molybdopterin cytidylyltransferase MocA